MTENGKAVIKVMLCKATKPPAFNNTRDIKANKLPHRTICLLEVLAAFLVAMLSITTIPESAEVTKNIMIIRITNKLVTLENGRYSKKLNISTSGLPAIRLKAPLACNLSIHMALLPYTVIQIKLNRVGMIRTAATKFLMVRPSELLTMNMPT